MSYQLIAFRDRELAGLCNSLSPEISLTKIGRFDADSCSEKE